MLLGLIFQLLFHHSRFLSVGLISWFYQDVDVLVEVLARRAQRFRRPEIKIPKFVLHPSAPHLNQHNRTVIKWLSQTLFSSGIFPPPSMPLTPPLSWPSRLPFIRPPHTLPCPLPSLFHSNGAWKGKISSMRVWGQAPAEIEIGALESWNVNRKEWTFVCTL